MISLHPSSARPQTSASIPSICHPLPSPVFRDSSALYLCLSFEFLFASCPARVRHFDLAFFIIRRLSDFSADPLFAVDVAPSAAAAALVAAAATFAERAVVAVVAAVPASVIAVAAAAVVTVATVVERAAAAVTASHDVAAAAVVERAGQDFRLSLRRDLERLLPLPRTVVSSFPFSPTFGCHI